MLVTIVYSEQFESNAKSLRTAIKEEWDGAKVNLMGTRRTLYQIQLEKDLVYSRDIVETNNNIIFNISIISVFIINATIKPCILY